MSTETVDGGAVREIERLANEAAVTTLEVDGVEYTTKPVYDPRKKEPEPEALVVATLRSFVEYAKSDIDGAYGCSRDLFVHVVSPTEVALRTGIFGRFNQRVELVVARVPSGTFQFGAWFDQESFMIGLLSLFEPTPARAALCQIAGNITEEAVKTAADDGVSQSVSARRGIVRRETVDVPNPHILTPFRTFSEVMQPASPFLFRLRGGGDGRAPSATLIECDGGRWKLDAVKAIKLWLTDELGDRYPVFG